MVRQLMGKIWLRVWRVTRWVAATLWNILHTEDVWREVYVSPGIRPEPTLRRFSYLRDRGVRCYLRNLASPNPRMGYTGMVSLRVHRDDLNKGYRLLNEVKD